MADEITYTMTLDYVKSLMEEHVPGISQQIDVAGSRKIHHVQQIGFASEEALVIGELASLGIGVFCNRDTINFLSIRVGTAGSKFMKILPGECWPLRLGSDVTAPYAIADTGNCYLEYWLFET